tara:strand:- start:34070 stop:34627 length:558 start_codon:yes stop_codon:yes gene_type:complete
MQDIKIIFCVLSSFFGMEDAKIAADKTTVTINPKEQYIEIIQENLFVFTESENDTSLAFKSWDNLVNWKERNIPWAKELDSFSHKSLKFTQRKKTIRPLLKLSYSNEYDLMEMGISFSAEENKFYLVDNPSYNIKTKNGSIVENYWVFNGDNAFSFTIEPFLRLPEKYQKLKHPLKELLVKHKKE